MSALYRVKIPKIGKRGFGVKKLPFPNAPEKALWVEKSPFSLWSPWGFWPLYRADEFASQDQFWGFTSAIFKVISEPLTIALPEARFLKHDLPVHSKREQTRTNENKRCNGSEVPQGQPNSPNNRFGTKVGQSLRAPRPAFWYFGGIFSVFSGYFRGKFWESRISGRGVFFRGIFRGNSGSGHLGAL